MPDQKPGIVGPSKELNDYWTKGAGAAKIAWGTPGDFNRCVLHLSKYIESKHQVEGYCASLHKKATGTRPGQH